jgi:hypothetical protein
MSQALLRTIAAWTGHDLKAAAPDDLHASMYTFTDALLYKEASLVSGSKACESRRAPPLSRSMNLHCRFL